MNTHKPTPNRSPLERVVWATLVTLRLPLVELARAAPSVSWIISTRSLIATSHRDHRGITRRLSRIWSERTINVEQYLFVLISKVWVPCLICKSINILVKGFPCCFNAWSARLVTVAAWTDGKYCIFSMNCKNVHMKWSSPEAAWPRCCVWRRPWTNLTSNVQSIQRFTQRLLKSALETWR